MGKRRISCFENCLMATTVQLCHVVSTFQAEEERGAKSHPAVRVLLPWQQTQLHRGSGVKSWPPSHV